MNKKNSFKIFSMNEFVPKLLICLKEGYSFSKFSHDVIAGLTIAVLTIPLAMALAISSGLSPERGLFTAIIAGFLISLLGGSRFQIGGPTGAFVVIVYDVVQRHGYEGLVLATFLAGIMLVAMGLLRFGTFLKFIPFPVTIGLTLGIALQLFASQIKDFLGLAIGTPPADFLDKLEMFYHAIDTFNPLSLFIAIATCLIIFGFRKFFPKVPGAIISVLFFGLIVDLFGLSVPTIASSFGALPSSLPIPHMPSFDLEKIRKIAPDAITIAVLAGLESLLSCVVADGISGYRHKSNCELLAQGIANIFSTLFGGMPATGAISRTATNIKVGAKTPISGILCACFVFLTMLLFSRFASKIPLATLAGILVVIAIHMADIKQVIEIFKGPKSDIALLLVTCMIAVLIDITVAVEVGILLAALFFMKRMADSTSISRRALKDLLHEREEKKDPDALYKKQIPEGVEVVQINGPLFFGAADLLSKGVIFSKDEYKIVILRMTHVPVIDMTGIKALQYFYDRCSQNGLLLLISGVNQKVLDVLTKTGLQKQVGKRHIFPHLDEALHYAKKKVVEL